MIVSSTTDALSRFGHALSDGTRTRVLLALRTSPSYPAELATALGVTRQALSNHLACLRGCGLVVGIPEGRRTRYELADARIADALDRLLDLVLVVDPACCGGEESGQHGAQAPMSTAPMSTAPVSTAPVSTAPVSSAGAG